MNLIKNLLWPHYNNSFHPYLLRAPALAFVTAGLVMVVVIFNLHAQTGQLLGVAENITEARLLELTNQQRAAAGIATLQPSQELSEAAKAKAADMLARGYWAHFGPSGETPWQFIKGSGYEYEYAGENLAKNFQTNDGVVMGWMNSPGHRENLLSSNYSEVGIAAADGELEGRPTTLVVALYASPQAAFSTLDRGETAAVETLPAVTTYSVVNPMSLFATMPQTSQILSLACLSFAILYLTQHLVVRNHHLLWDSHIHPRPALQAAMFLGFAFMLVQISFGAVG